MSDLDGELFSAEMWALLDELTRPRMSLQVIPPRPLGPCPVDVDPAETARAACRLAYRRYRDALDHT